MVKSDYSLTDENGSKDAQQHGDMKYEKEKHRYRESGMDKNQQISQTIEEGESQDDYLGRLICTGCGKQCSLLNPRCGKGQMQAQEAIEYYDQNVENGSVDAESISSTERTTETKQFGEEKKIRLSVDEDYFDLFKAYIPITGLYIAGTYYILEIIERKKSRKE